MGNELTDAITKVNYDCPECGQSVWAIKALKGTTCVDCQFKPSVARQLTDIGNAVAGQDGFINMQTTNDHTNENTESEVNTDNNESNNHDNLISTDNDIKTSDKPIMNKNEEIKIDNTLKDDIDWICSSCTFSNSCVLEYCEICNDPRNNAKDILKNKSDLDINKNNSRKQQLQQHDLADIDNGNWKCCVCTFNNCNMQQQCQMCGHTKDNKENKTAIIQNNNNSSKHNRKYNQSKTNKANWKCLTCNFNNSAASQQCKMCQTTRIEDIEHVPDSWNCKRCTYTNANELLECEICGNKKSEKKIQGAIDAATPGKNIEYKNEKERKISDEFELFLAHVVKKRGGDFEKYLNKFVQDELNDIRFVLDMNQQIAKDIGMNSIECAAFGRHVKEFKEKNQTFKNWLKSLQLFDEYYDCFETNAILNFQLFYKYIRNEKDIVNIIGADNMNDAILLMNKNPKNVRKQSMNQVNDHGGNDEQIEPQIEGHHDIDDENHGQTPFINH